MAPPVGPRPGFHHPASRPTTELDLFRQRLQSPLVPSPVSRHERWKLALSGGRVAAALAVILTAVGAAEARGELARTAARGGGHRTAARALMTSADGALERGTAARWIDRATLRTAVAAIAERDRAEVGLAVRSLGSGSLVTAGDLMTASAWSTIKVPIVLARYRLADEQRQANRASIGALAKQALTASDNAAGAQLFAEIEAATGGLAPASRFVGRELTAAGDDRTRINTVDPGNGFSTYGQTQWSLAAGTQFFRQLARGCVPPHDETGYVLALMAEIIPSQRWGVGSVQWPRGAAVQFKGGWGPDKNGDYLVRQFGIIEGGDDRGVVVGLLAHPDDGQFETGVHVLDQLATAVARSLHIARTSVYSSCR